MKKKKNIIVELIVLITIFASLFIVYYIYKELNDIKPKESDTSSVQNYSQTKIIKIEKDLNDAITTLNIPDLDSIVEGDLDNRYDFFITATDNKINTISEIIVIQYNTQNKDNITNFCNSYNDIESAYILKCNEKYLIVTIKNTYHLDKIYTNTIQTKNYEFKFPIKNGDKLNEYLDEITKEGITYEEVKEIN